MSSPMPEATVKIGPAMRPGERRQDRPETEDDGVKSRDIDAEGADHHPVRGAGADQHPEPRLRNQEIERPPPPQADADDGEPIEPDRARRE